MTTSVKYKLFNSKLTAIVSVSLVLVLLGITTIVLLMSKNLSDHVRENFIFKLTLKEGVSDKAIADLGDTLRAKPYINAVNYISKEQAVKDFAEQLGEDPMESLDVNPLPNSYEVSLVANRLANDSLKFIEEDLLRYRAISDVDYPHDLVDSFNRNVRSFSAVFLFFAGLLLFISFALINNTIRLLIYSDRFLIYTMEQVGATREFIRRPYMRQALIGGLVASVLAIAMLVVILFCMGGLSEDITLFVDVYNTSMVAAAFAVVLVTGVLITGLATYFAVNRYLSRSLASLYAY